MELQYHALIIMPQKRKKTSVVIKGYSDFYKISSLAYIAQLLNIH